MSRAYSFILLAFGACSPLLASAQNSTDQDSLPPIQQLRGSYPDGRMTLGFRQLNSLKKHLERLEAIKGRYKFTSEEFASLQLARAFFDSIDLSDLRTSIVVAQIDIARFEIYVKKASDQLAGMDRVGGLSTTSVQQTARIVDAIVRRTGLFERSMGSAATLADKYVVLREAAIAPFVVTATLETAASGFLEAVSKSPDALDVIRRNDPVHYVEVARWLASARLASVSLEKSAPDNKPSHDGVFDMANLGYAPTPWATGKLEKGLMKSPSTSLSALVKKLTDSSFAVNVEPGELKGIDYATSYTNGTLLASYEQASELKDKIFSGYDLDRTYLESKFVNLSGFPVIVSSTAPPSIGGQWRPSSHVGYVSAIAKRKYFPLVEVAAKQEFSGVVALDTLFVLLSSR